MLKSLKIKNLTVFEEAELHFSPGLNVFVGENGTGKSHLLKAPYAVMAASAEEARKPNSGPPSKTGLQSKLADKLVAVFRPESLGRLARRRVGAGRCEIVCRFDRTEYDVAFGFTSKSKSEAVVDALPSAWLEKPPVFLPARELLTLYPGFLSMYESHYLEFEETWRDACILLGGPPVRGPREKHVDELLAPLETVMGGAVELDRNGRFYLRVAGQGRLEMPLVAEGVRKLAMAARLISTGALLDEGCLFWDEPETNLNSKLVREAARFVLRLCRSGIQAFVATHSLFLLREFDILLKSEEFAGSPARFIGLQPGAAGVETIQGDDVDACGDLAALEAELEQSDRYLRAGG